MIKTGNKKHYHHEESINVIKHHILKGDVIFHLMNNENDCDSNGEKKSQEMGC